MKLYTKKIESCEECPACTSDINYTRYECSKKSYEFIKWHHDEKNLTIPDWCPLEDYKDPNKEVRCKNCDHNNRGGCSIGQGSNCFLYGYRYFKLKGTEPDKEICCKNCKNYTGGVCFIGKGTACYLNDYKDFKPKENKSNKKVKDFIKEEDMKIE